MTRLPPGETVTADNAGWRYLNFAARSISGRETLMGSGQELAVVSLSGGFRLGDVVVEGRASVWGGLPSAAYVRDADSIELEPLGESAVVAMASEPTTGRLPTMGPVRIGPEDVRVEIRGRTSIEEALKRRCQAAGRVMTTSPPISSDQCR